MFSPDFTVGVIAKTFLLTVACKMGPHTIETSFSPTDQHPLLFATKFEEDPAVKEGMLCTTGHTAVTPLLLIAGLVGGNVVYLLFHLR